MRFIRSRSSGLSSYLDDVFDEFDGTGVFDA